MSTGPSAALAVLDAALSSGGAAWRIERALRLLLRSFNSRIGLLWRARGQEDALQQALVLQADIIDARDVLAAHLRQKQPSPPRELLWWSRCVRGAACVLLPRLLCRVLAFLEAHVHQQACSLLSQLVPPGALAATTAALPGVALALTGRLLGRARGEAARLKRPALNTASQQAAVAAFCASGAARALLGAVLSRDRRAVSQAGAEAVRGEALLLRQWLAAPTFDSETAVPLPLPRPLLVLRHLQRPWARLQTALMLLQSDPRSRSRSRSRAGLGSGLGSRASQGQAGIGADGGLTADERGRLERLARRGRSSSLLSLLLHPPAHACSCLLGCTGGGGGGGGGGGFGRVGVEPVELLLDDTC